MSRKVLVDVYLIINVNQSIKPDNLWEEILEIAEKLVEKVAKTQEKAQKIARKNWLEKVEKSRIAVLEIAEKLAGWNPRIWVRFQKFGGHPALTML